MNTDKLIILFDHIPELHPMNIKRVTLFVILCQFMLLNSFSQDVHPDSKTDVGCGKDVKPQDLCIAVSESVRDLTGEHKFAFMKIFFDFVCAEPISNFDPDKDEKRKVAFAKIRDFWNNHGGKDITCSAFGSYQNGSLLKLAVHRKFHDFLLAAILLKLDLNEVSGSDNSTVLDYVDYLIEINEGNPANRDVYRTYQTWLEEAGAKRNLK